MRPGLRQQGGRGGVRGGGGREPGGGPRGDLRPHAHEDMQARDKTRSQSQASGGVRQCPK